GDTRISPALRGENLDAEAAAESARAVQLGKPHLAHAADTKALDQHVPAADALACLKHAQASLPSCQRRRLPSLTDPPGYLLYRRNAASDIPAAEIAAREPREEDHWHRSRDHQLRRSGDGGSRREGDRERGRQPYHALRGRVQHG